MLVGLVVHQGEYKKMQYYRIEEDEDSHESARVQGKTHEINVPIIQQTCGGKFTYE